MNILLIGIAFLCEFIDSSLGMGYGTTLTPLLLLLGFNAIEVVPCILVSELCTGIFSAYLHHKNGNVDFSVNSNDLKVALVIGGFSAIGCVAAVLTAISIPKIALNTIISIIVISMGLITLLTLNKNTKFAWWKVGVLGTIASFNKGMSGGGYGPLVMGGQVFAGIKTKSAIGITSFAESITCLIGIILFMIAGTILNNDLLVNILMGAMISVPLSVFVVKKLPEKKIKIGVGIFILALGLFTLIKMFLGV